VPCDAVPCDAEYLRYKEIWITAGARRRNPGQDLPAAGMRSGIPVSTVNLHALVSADQKLPGPGLPLQPVPRRAREMIPLS